MKKLTILLLATAVLAAACSSSGTSSGAAVDESRLKDPKSSIEYQLELVKAGDADKLKSCVMPAVRDRITQEAVDKAKTNAANYTIDDLYASNEPGEQDGQKTVKVIMKNGRTLTMLVEDDGKWLSNSVWFK
jgi:hypothetical protein